MILATGAWAQTPQAGKTKKENPAVVAEASQPGAALHAAQPTTQSSATPLVGQKSLVPISLPPLNAVIVASPADTSNDSSVRKPKKN